MFALGINKNLHNKNTVKYYKLRLLKKECEIQRLREKLKEQQQKK